MATAYFSSDLTFEAMYNMVLRELHEAEVSGTEAVPVELVKDKLNEVYADVFNDMRIKQSAREKTISFSVVPDDSLAVDAAIGAVSLVLNSSDNFRSSGRILLPSEITNYTNNNTGTETLTGVTALQIAHYAGEVVRQMYLLTALASDIDEEQIQLLTVNGIPLTPQGFDRLISINGYIPYSYAVYQGYLILARGVSSGSGGSVGQGLMIYSQKVTPLSATTDKPTLIPNQLRIPLLVYGACARIAAADAFRTSWDWWTKEYDRALSQYIAFKNTRTKDRANRTRPTINRSQF